jgi:hypothetical protein
MTVQIYRFFRAHLLIIVIVKFFILEINASVAIAGKNF